MPDQLFQGVLYFIVFKEGNVRQWCDGSYLYRKGSSAVRENVLKTFTGGQGRSVFLAVFVAMAASVFDLLVRF